MPILLVLFVAASCLKIPWPSPPFGAGPGESVLLTALVTAVPILAATILGGWVVRALEHGPERRRQVLARYLRFRRLFVFGNLAAAAVAVGGCGWGATVWKTLEVDISPVRAAVDSHLNPGTSAPTADGQPVRVLFPGAELLVPAPYFLILFAGWVVFYPAERALHRTSPSVRDSQNPTAFWGPGEYLGFHLRQFALMIALPIGLFVAQQSLARVTPDLVRSGWFQVASFIGAGVIFVLLPRAVKPLLGLKPLPPGPTRDRLEATARRLNFRYTELLLWPTRGAMANAMVLGVVPWARYVVFTDRLLDQLAPDELDAVLGHEVGHVRHLHIPFYAAFFMLSATVASVAAEAGARALTAAGWELPEGADEFVALPVVAMAAYVFVVFGLLSRRCERQADVFGCRAGSCTVPDCTGHTADTVLVPAGRGCAGAGRWHSSGRSTGWPS
ncbi:M48 family metallopeptidase [Fimbriiglobus ruber]|uniref:M48 family metallopeptidase n=1 Tax=Fimbriiglobus ruber TaxID=1908690 RepID=UPI000B4B7F65|nr:M48 family metallopeptidase [Fimbriiglobus ruber]